MISAARPPLSRGCAATRGNFNSIEGGAGRWSFHFDGDDELHRQSETLASRAVMKKVARVSQLLSVLNVIYARKVCVRAREFRLRVLSRVRLNYFELVDRNLKRNFRRHVIYAVSVKEFYTLCGGC